MSDKKSLTDKLNEMVFGEPIPVLSANDLEIVRNLDKKMDLILPLLDRSGIELQQFNKLPAEKTEGDGSSKTQESLDDLIEQVRKLAKTQFKTNTLQESQLNQHQEALQNLQTALTQQKELLTQQAEQAVEDAELKMAKKLLPVMDSLDAAFNTGSRQIVKFRSQMPPEVQQAVIAWLDGIRMARLRLLDVLAAYDITPVPSVGELFNPHRHIAVGTDNSGRVPNNTIVSEDRRGYTTPKKIIREAEVVVARG